MPPRDTVQAGDALVEEHAVAMLRRHRVDVRAHGRVGEAGDASVAVALPVGLAVEGDPAGDVEDSVEVFEADARRYVVLDLW